MPGPSVSPGVYEGKKCFQEQFPGDMSGASYTLTVDNDLTFVLLIVDKDDYVQYTSRNEWKGQIEEGNFKFEKEKLSVSLTVDEGGQITLVSANDGSTQLKKKAS